MRKKEHVWYELNQRKRGVHVSMSRKRARESVFELLFATVCVCMRLWQLLSKINKPDPGQFVSDKQCLATRNPFGNANSASFDEVGIE